MKKITLLLTVLVIGFSGWGQIISQYIETNAGSEPKGIEIWNNTASALDFSTNNLEIWKGTNGADPSEDYTLSTGTLAAGAVIVIGTSDLQTVTEDNGSVFYEKGFTFNGDDALEVWYGTTKTDVFGEPGVDPGSAWTGNGVSTANQNIQLLSGITTGDTDGWDDPSLRFETVSTDPSGAGGDVGFGIAPAGDGVENPATFAAAAASTSQIDLTFTTNTDDDNVVIVYDADDTFTDPSGAPPAVGESFAGGTLLYNGTTSPQNHTGLSNNETVYYKAWSYDDTDYSSGVISNATTLEDEPSNHVTAFDAATGSSTTIDLTWTENDGTIVPAGYLILANTGAIIDPVDGTDPADDTDLTDGVGNVKVAHGSSSYSFTNCSPSTTYNFSIYPYTNSGADIDFKTVPSAPTDAATTATAAAEPTAGDLIITEVSGDGVNSTSDDGFMEIYNASAVELSLANVEARYFNSNNGQESTQEVALSGSIAAGEFIIVTQNAANFLSEYGIAADFSGSQFYFNGGDDGCDVYHTTNGVIDQFNDNGIGQTAWDWDDDYSWDRNSTTSGATISNWTQNETSTPKAFGLGVWTGGTSTTWTDNNNWLFMAQPSSTANVLIETGATNYPVLTSNVTCNSVIIKTGATLNVPQGIELTIDGDLTTDGDVTRFVIESNALGNGSVIINGFTDYATVERYIPAHTTDGGWHNMASPADMMDIGGSDFDPGTNDDLYKWDEATNTWVNYKGGNWGLDQFYSTEGYLVAYETASTRSFTGLLTNMDWDFTGLSYTPAEGNGWHLLGNPYSSAIEWDGTNWELSNIGGIAKIYNDPTGNYTDLNNGDVIPSTNGFFVQATDATNYIKIPASARLHSSQNNYKKSAADLFDETLVLTINNDENMYSDLARIGFKENATEERDIEFDSQKLFGASKAPQLWSKTNGHDYSQNYLPYVYENYQVSLNFRAGVNTTYHINADGLESFYGNSEIYLEDLIAEEVINLNEQQLYTFIATTDDDEARFILHFYGVTSVDGPITVEEAKIYAADNTVYIKFNRSTNDNSQVEVFNTIGQQVYSKDLAPQSLSSFNLNEKPGIYIIRLRTESGLTTQKVMIK